MRVQVLGPMNTDGDTLSPRERSMLAALLVRAGQVMSGSELADAYWGDAPPHTWSQQVKTSVARIRARLGADVIRTSPGGYALTLEMDSVDAVRFERLVSSAREHSLHLEHERARDSYDRALSLWRGPAYQDLREWPPGVAEAHRLEELRQSAEDELLETRLALGEARGVIPDAERMVREDPLREGRWAVLALANYQIGRQAEALACLRSARTRLSDELGIDPGRRIVELETAILRQDPALDLRPTAPVSAECPYRGLSAYRGEDADEFFGRDDDIERVLVRLRGGSLLALVGASGCGKSSLAMAGVLPRLRDRGTYVTVIRPAQLEGVRHGGGSVVFIDQFEELFGLPDAQIDAGSAHLRALVESGVTVVVTVRSDFLDRCLAQPDLASLFSEGVYPVLPMDREELRAAIERPARLAGLRLEAGLTELILRDAASEPAALPMMSHALVETWTRREGSVLTVAGYQTAGGIGGAIAKSAEQLYQGLAVAEQDACRAVMLRLLERGTDGTTVRRRIHSRPLATDDTRRDIIRRLVDARLVSVEGDSLVIAHESVANAWPRLDAWLDEDAAGARIIGALSAAAEAWEIEGEPAEDLYRGARLQSVQEWRDSKAPDLTETEVRFLEASSAHARTELDEREAQVARELRQNRHLRWALAGAAGLLVVALVSGGFAVIRGNDAAAAAEDARIEAITSRSLSLRDTNRDVAALLAVEAHRRWPDDARTRAALMGTMTDAGPFTDVVYIPDARWRIGAWPINGTDTVAVVRDYRHLEIHDERSGGLVRSIAELPDTDHLFRPWVRVSRDASTILVMQHVDEDEQDRDDLDVGVARDELLTFYDMGTGRQIGESVFVDELAETVALSPDGSMATWATMGNTIVVDRDTSAVRRTDVTRLTVERENIANASSTFREDGMIVVSNLDGAVRVIDPATLEVVTAIMTPFGATGLETVATADGLVASYGPDAISVTDVISKQVVWRGDLAGAECSRMTVSAVQRLVICGDEVGLIHRWDLDTGEVITPRWDYQLGGGGDLTLSEDESELLLMSAIAPAIARVRIDGSGPASTGVGDPHAFVDTRFDPSGRYIVLGDRRERDDGVDEPLRRVVWDMNADEAALRIPDDILGADGKQIWDVRWVGQDTLFAWTFDPQLREKTETDAEAEATGIIDIATGVFTETDLPDNVWWVFMDPAGEMVYVALADRDDTPEEESSEVRTYDARTWERLPATFDVEGKVEAVSTTPDRSRVLIGMHLAGEPAYRTALFDGEGGLLDEGLPTAQQSVILSDGSSVVAAAQQITQFAPGGFSGARPLPSNVGFPFNMSATERGELLLTHGFGSRSLAIIDVPSGRQLGDSLDTDVRGGTSWIRPDGSSFVTSSASGVQLWTLDPDDHRDAACRLAGREPTAEEWATHFAGLGEQHPLCADVIG
jgi:DNA-binding SARP family transcriptional activator